jgi:hypothetical protein
MDGGVWSASTSWGQVAAKVTPLETLSHTCAHSAPVPRARNIAIRAGRSSVAYPLVTASENWLSTSYGAALPRPHRSAAVSRAACTRAKDNATTVVATMDSGGLGDWVRPIKPPPPSTTTT